MAAFGKPVVPWKGQFETGRDKLKEGVRKSLSDGLKTDELDPEQITPGIITEVNRMVMGSSCDSFLCRSWSCWR